MAISSEPYSEIDRRVAIFPSYAGNYRLPKKGAFTNYIEIRDCADIEQIDLESLKSELKEVETAYTHESTDSLRDVRFIKQTDRRPVPVHKWLGIRLRFIKQTIQKRQHKAANK